VFSEELHAIELSPIVWPMKAVGIGGSGLLRQEEHANKPDSKMRFESNFDFIRIIANSTTLDCDKHEP
jgi:hypothetical protein